MWGFVLFPGTGRDQESQNGWETLLKQMVHHAWRWSAASTGAGGLPRDARVAIPAGTDGGMEDEAGHSSIQEYQPHSLRESRA